VATAPLPFQNQISSSSSSSRCGQVHNRWASPTRRASADLPRRFWACPRTCAAVHSAHPPEKRGANVASGGECSWVVWADETRGPWLKVTHFRPAHCLRRPLRDDPLSMFRILAAAFAAHCLRRPLRDDPLSMFRILAAAFARALRAPRAHGSFGRAKLGDLGSRSPTFVRLTASADRFAMTRCRCFAYLRPHSRMHTEQGVEPPHVTRRAGWRFFAQRRDCGRRADFLKNDRSSRLEPLQKSTPGSPSMHRGARLRAVGRWLR